MDERQLKMVFRVALSSCRSAGGSVFAAEWNYFQGDEIVDFLVLYFLRNETSPDTFDHSSYNALGFKFMLLL